jgi:hypothetical protein
LKWWNRLSLLCLALLLGLSLVTSSQRVGGLVVAVGGAIQIPFAIMLLANRRAFADRSAEYYAHRPLMLGGFFPNRSPAVQRAQGGAMLLLGVVLVIFGIVLMLSATT